jgi:hypothetical protein
MWPKRLCFFSIFLALFLFLSLSMRIGSHQIPCAWRGVQTTVAPFHFFGEKLVIELICHVLPFTLSLPQFKLDGRRLLSCIGIEHHNTRKKTDVVYR